jgi:hypothetical protein
MASYVTLRIITSTSKTNPTTFLEIETFIKSSSNLDCDEVYGATEPREM